jgi:hypothetical protein
MKKSVSSLLSLYAAMGLYSMYDLYNTGECKKRIDELTEGERLLLAEQLNHAKREIMKKRGLKEFEIDGYTVLALNEKNAKRKIEKIKRSI